MSLHSFLGTDSWADSTEDTFGTFFAGVLTDLLKRTETGEEVTENGATTLQTVTETGATTTAGAGGVTTDVTMIATAAQIVMVGIGTAEAIAMVAATVTAEVIGKVMTDMAEVIALEVTVSGEAQVVIGVVALGNAMATVMVIGPALALGIVAMLQEKFPQSLLLLLTLATYPTI